MAAEGRWLGGRPPYGYRLVDAGEHPNRSKARDGKRLHRLDVDPATGPVVTRIFDDYVRGRGLRILADELTAEGIPSPSAADPDRNGHRQGSAGVWSRSALRAILLNPTYTGHRHWARGRRQEVLVDPADPGLGYRSRLKANSPDAWVIAADETNPALVDPDTFKAAQERLVSRRGGRGPRERTRGRRAYALRGLVRCAVCDAYVPEGRRLEGVTIETRTYYRCRLSGPDYARSAALDATHPKCAYLPEKRVLGVILDRIVRRFDPDHVDETIEALNAAAKDEIGEARRAAEADRWRRQLIDADEKLAKYRALVDDGAAPIEVVGRWIADADLARRTALEELDRLAPQPPTSTADIRAMILAMGDLRARLDQADPDMLRTFFEEIDLRVVWTPGAPEVDVSYTLGRGNARVGEGT
jgi:site-specific DNA recombinase